MTQCITGVDIGTGSAKAVALDTNGKIIAISQSYYPTLNPKAGYSEQDPEIIWTAFVHCIREIATKNKHLGMAVSFSCAMHSLLVVDKNNSAITPLITWADTRSEKIARDIRNSSEGQKIYTATGTPVHSMSPLCKITWLKENEPLIFKNACKFISIKEFIWYRLFNSYQVDFSMASSGGLFNIEQLEWNTDSLRLCGITAEHLSEIVSTEFTRNDVDPSVEKELGLPPGTFFCIGASDGCLANVGSQAINKGIAALTIGTSGAVRIANATPVNNYAAMIFNYILDKKTFICGGPVNNGGNIVKWLFQTFFDNPNPGDADYERLFTMIETIPAGCQGLVFLPYLYGERGPIWDEKAAGVFMGIKSFHRTPHFLRATLEGICFALKTILEIIENYTSPVTQLNVSGGFVHSKTWIHILADVCGKKICLDQTEDASSIGAALFYMRVSGLIADYSALDSGVHEFIEPAEINHVIYEKYYAVFKTLYEPLKEAMHRLHDIDNQDTDPHAIS